MESSKPNLSDEILDSDSDNEEKGLTYKRKYEESDISENEEETVIVEESSESEPDVECDIWDYDCVTIPSHKRENSVVGFNVGKGLMPVPSPESIIAPCKQQKLSQHISLNENVTKKDFITLFKEHWCKNNSFKLNCVDFVTDPFRVCFVDDFIETVDILHNVRNQMCDVGWCKRNLDLYEFFQSDDLLHVNEIYIKQIYEFLKSDVRSWMSELTGLELTRMSATCSFYSDTDYLLIHDDLQEDRAIAFILYLTDPVSYCDELWKEEMGGALVLFNKDDAGHPKAPVKYIYPRNNRFAFFKVTNDSYHQVSEVLNMDHCRLSINGWFHTTKPNEFVSPKLEPPLKGLYSLHYLKPIACEINLAHWISPEYLRKSTRKEIQKQIESESQISLIGFFHAEKFQELCDALQNNDIIWEWTGPCNRRKYEVISTENIPSIVSEFLTLFQSKNMFVLLKDYTDLDLIEQHQMQPKLRMELQRWTPGCYSLFSEYDNGNESELDVIMYLGCTAPVVGGQVIYVATDEKIEDALITLEPKDNTLNIIYRDTSRLVKHVSMRSQIKYFYKIVCTYKE